MQQRNRDFDRGKEVINLAKVKVLTILDTTSAI
jgi:hypothetical protein